MQYVVLHQKVYSALGSMLSNMVCTVCVTVFVGNLELFIIYVNFHHSLGQNETGE